MTTPTPAAGQSHDEDKPQFVGYVLESGKTHSVDYTSDSTYRTQQSYWACCPPEPKTCTWFVGCVSGSIIASLDSLTTIATAKCPRAGDICATYSMYESSNQYSEASSPKRQYYCFSSYDLTFYRTISAGAGVASSKFVPETLAPTTTKASKGEVSRDTSQTSVWFNTAVLPSDSTGTRPLSVASSSSTTPVSAAGSKDSSLGVNGIVGIVFGSIGLVVAILTAWITWKMWLAKKAKRSQ